MFHLFGNTYLEHDFRYTSQYCSMIASENFLDDPLIASIIDDDTLMTSTSFSELLKTKFEDEPELLWAFLFAPKTPGRFLFYVESETYNKLQIQFWKSTFSNLTFEICYKLHQLHIQDLKLKTGFAVSNINQSIKSYHEKIKIISEQEYRLLFENEKESSFVRNLGHSDRSFEYLMASYFSRPEADWKESFLEKLKMFSWEMLIDEINILRSEVTSGIYDYLSYDLETKKKKNDFENSIESLLDYIKADHNFMWLIDNEITAKNIDYIKSAYTKESFTNYLGHQFNKFSEKDNIDLSDEKLFKAFEFVFEGRYLDLLEFDISSGFGSLLFSNPGRFKVNLLLLSYFYDLYRSGNPEKFVPYEVVNNDL